MSAPKEQFDFWYAINNTQVVVLPRRHLETFGATDVNYHLVSELMDRTDQVRVREGQIQSYRPEIVTPQDFLGTALEGFSEDAARQYVDWLREHEKDLLLLKYGFRIRKRELNEHIVTDRVDLVVDRVKAELAAKDQPQSALVLGVEEPWEVCLLKLMVEMIQQSAPGHALDLRDDPRGERHEIEEAFRAASADSSRIGSLADLLRKRNLFKQYEDRFFALIRSNRR
jgi:hypothetical protein